VKTIISVLGWVSLFAVSLLVGWYVSRPSETGAQPDSAERLAKAKPVYVTHCAQCHGADGQGDPAMLIALKPPPRDFRERPWKNPITSTAIRHVILNGIPGTGMTPHRGIISEDQAELLSEYVIRLSEASSESSVFQWHASPQAVPDAELVSADGQRLKLSEIADQPLLVHFWGTTCVHCLAEMAQMQSDGTLEGRLGVRIVGICVDSTQASEAAELVKSFAPGHVVYVDPSGLVGQQFGVSALPAYRVIDGGKVLASYVGTLPWGELDAGTFLREGNH